MKTSARCRKEPNPRITLTCPVCGKRFTLMPSEYRKTLKRKFPRTCSRSCAMVRRYVINRKEREP